MLDFHQYYSESDDKHVGRLSLLAIHFGRLGIYRKDWKLEEIIIYEAMLVLSRKFGNKPFFFQQDRFMEFARISDTLFRKYRTKLIELGILTYERKGPNRMNYYTIHYDAIVDNLEKIYDFSGLESKMKKKHKKTMEKFFNYWKWNQHCITDERYLKKQQGEFVPDAENPYEPDEWGIKRKNRSGS